MKIQRSLTAAFILAIGLLPATSWAANRSGALTLSPMAGGIVLEGDQHLDNDVAYSLGLGYNFTQSFGVEAVLAYANPEKENANDDVDLWNYRIDALYHFMPDSALVPYVALGIGGYDLDSDREFMANYGLGLLYSLTDSVALRADVRHLAVFNESNLENNLLYTAGLKFQFGGREEAPAPVAAAAVSPPTPLDSDGDGVTDDRDQCPDTPRGVNVDDKGCPLDSDRDGVTDDRDQCPDTLKGVVVDDKGCELKLTLHINFGFDKTAIRPEFKSELEKAAAFVRKHSDIPYILLAGHTDSIGTEEYNRRLSMERAQAVRQALIEDYGIDGSKLITRGYGESRPVASNETEEGRYQNRRVELICCAVLPE